MITVSTVNRGEYQPYALSSGTDPPRCSLHKTDSVFLSISPKFLKNADFAEKVLTSAH